MQNVIQKQMQALTCYFVVPAYIQQTTNDRNTLTPKQRIALDPSCHRKNQARQPRGSGCRPRTCGEKYSIFWWRLMTVMTMSLVIWVRNPQMMTDDDNNCRVVGLKMARWLQVVEGRRKEERWRISGMDAKYDRQWCHQWWRFFMMINMRLIFLILMPFFEDSIFVLQVVLLFWAWLLSLPMIDKIPRLTSHSGDIRASNIEQVRRSR